MAREEEVVGHTQATQPMPIIGETIVLMERMYRCVSVIYVDAKESGGVPEIRVRFKQEATR